MSVYVLYTCNIVPQNIFDPRWVEPMDRENPPAIVGMGRKPHSEFKNIKLDNF